MSGVRAMLTRVARLEQVRATPRTPFEVAYGSMTAFADNTQALIDGGTLDSRDMPVVIRCLQNWHENRVWAGWTRHGNGFWEHGR